MTEPYGYTRRLKSSSDNPSRGSYLHTFDVLDGIKRVTGIEQISSKRARGEAIQVKYVFSNKDYATFEEAIAAYEASLIT